VKKTYSRPKELVANSPQSEWQVGNADFREGMGAEVEASPGDDYGKRGVRRQNRKGGRGQGISKITVSPASALHEPMKFGGGWNPERRTIASEGKRRAP